MHLTASWLMAYLLVPPGTSCCPCHSLECGSWWLRGLHHIQARSRAPLPGTQMSRLERCFFSKILVLHGRERLSAPRRMTRPQIASVWRIYLLVVLTLASVSYLLHLNLPSEEFEASLLGYRVNVCQKCLQLAPAFGFSCQARPAAHRRQLLLEAELREDAADRARCLRAAPQWPFCPQRRIAHATDGAWYQIAKGGDWRRIFGAGEAKFDLPRCYRTSCHERCSGRSKTQTSSGRQCADPSALHYNPWFPVSLPTST